MVFFMAKIRALAEGWEKQACDKNTAAQATGSVYFVSCSSHGFLANSP
jgi:hypothetical protein